MVFQFPFKRVKPPAGDIKVLRLCSSGSPPPSRPRLRRGRLGGEDDGVLLSSPPMAVMTKVEKITYN